MFSDSVARFRKSMERKQKNEVSNYRRMLHKQGITGSELTNEVALFNSTFTLAIEHAIITIIDMQEGK